jgi:hypothetical protein
MHAYRISTGRRLEKGDALSCRKFTQRGQWARAFFSRILPNGDLAVTFEGSSEESFVSPSATHDVMVRRDSMRNQLKDSGFKPCSFPNNSGEE